ncbi:MAG: asparagine synthase-related protein [Planctomycetota bacterium]|nr:asparagine synthase-related protein [Planctomycetota bacterium]
MEKVLLWGFAHHPNKAGSAESRRLADKIASTKDARWVTGPYWGIVCESGPVGDGSIGTDPLRRTHVGIAGKVWPIDGNTKEDSGLLADLYDRHEGRLLNHCDGQFAAVVVDETRGRTLLTVGWPGGFHFLYYRLLRGTLFFATRIAALLRLCGERAEVNEHALVELFRLGGILAEETLFAGVSRVLPGCSVVYQAGEAVQRSTLDIPSGTVLDPENAEAFFEVYSQAVRRRMSDTHDVGAFLSGGLDSSMNVAVMAQNSSKPVKTFSIRFSPSEFDESPYARLVASAFGTDHHEFVIDQAACMEPLPEMVWAMEEPILDYSYVPTFHLAKATKQEVDVVISGDGPDHLLGRCYSLATRAQLLGFVPRAVSARLWHAATEADRHGLWPTLWRYLIQAPFGRSAAQGISAAGCLGRAGAWSGLGSGLWDYLPTCEFADLLSKPLLKRAGNEGYYNTAQLPTLNSGASLFNRAAADDASISGICAVFAKVGHMCGAHGLVVREPFLARPVVLYTFGLARHWKVQGGFIDRLRGVAPPVVTKVVLRRAAEGRLPAEILAKRKQGFTPPLVHWWRQVAPGLTAQQVFGSLLQHTDWFNVPYLDRLLQEHRSSQQDRHSLLMLLAAVDQWHRIYIRSDAGRPSWQWSDCLASAC